MKDEEPKPVRWIGSSRKDIKTFPARVRSDMGKALYAAQRGERDPAAKPLKGFGPPQRDGDSRALWWRHVARSVHGSVSRGSLRFACLSEEVEKRIATPKREIELIRQRLMDAERDHRERQN